MKFLLRLREHLRSRIIIGAVGAVAGLVLSLTHIGRPLRNFSYDIPFSLFRSPRVNTNIVIIQLDDATFTDLNQTPNNFDRRLHAATIDLLAGAGAKLVLFDIVFADTNTVSGADQQFLRAATNYGRTILAAWLVKQPNAGVPELKLIRSVPPLDQLRWGLSSLILLGDRTPRLIDPGTDRFMTLPWKAVELLGGEAMPFLERKKQRWLNYYGPHPFPKISFSDFFLNSKSWTNDLAGKIVFIGRATEAGYAGEEKEQFTSPWTTLHNENIYGVEGHALALANLLSDDWLRHSSFLDAVLIALFGLAVGFLLPSFSPLLATFIALGLAAFLFAAASLLQLELNWWFAWVIPVLIQLPIALGGAILVGSIQAYVEVKNLERSLIVHLSPERARQLATRRELLQPGAKPQLVSVLFSDIENYATICDRTPLGGMIGLMNHYFDSVLPCVKDCHGTVINLIGDAVFAVWNAPEEQPEHAEFACRAALALRQNLINFEADNENYRLRTRVGIHSGQASVGNIGSKDRFDYTAIGTNINLAARLEGLNKFLGTDILLTDDLLELIQSKYDTRAVGYFRFKGLDRVIRVHELIGDLNKSEKPAPWRETFKSALRDFRDGKFAEAETKFAKVLTEQEKDGPSLFYIQRCKKYRETPPKDWTGEIKLDEK